MGWMGCGCGYEDRTCAVGLPMTPQVWALSQPGQGPGSGAGCSGCAWLSAGSGEGAAAADPTGCWEQTPALGSAKEL